MTTLYKTSRRDFLKISSVTGSGLLLGFSWFSAEAETPFMAKKANIAGDLGFNSYLSIGTDGTITIFFTQS
jgi:isoquinoline 1-oxidoreductase beta subunit